MTLQWTFVAGCMYVEIFIISLLLLPFISPSRWQRVFRSRIVGMLKAYSNIYFNVIILVLVALFCDSIREIRKYSEPIEIEDLKHHPDAETKFQMKLFRAQRNMYIAGFALFLWFVVRRLVTLIAKEAALTAESTAAKRQAESATAAAQQLLDEKDNSKNSGEEESKDKGDKQLSRDAENLKQAREQLEQTKEDLVRAKLDFEVMKKQAESVTNEYDRLLEEHSKLQKQRTVLEGADNSEAKKDN